MRQHPLRVAHQVAQQLELGGREVHLVAAPGDLVAVLVHRQVAHDEQRAALVGRDRGAPHQRAQPRDDLLEAERLGDVVVAAGGEPGDAVLDGVLRGEEQHRHVRVVAAHPAQHLEPVEVGEHHVEHDGIRAEVLRGPHGGQPAGGGAHLPPLVAQGHREQLGEVRLVVDHEHPNRAAVGSLEGWGAHGAGRRHGSIVVVSAEASPWVPCAVPVSGPAGLPARRWARHSTGTGCGRIVVIDRPHASRSTP